MDGGVWYPGVTRFWTGLSDFTFTFHFHALEKEMATHSSVLAWRIPGMGEPGGLLSMGSHMTDATLRDPMDCSLPGSSVHGILQARVLEWIAISFSNA